MADNPHLTTAPTPPEATDEATPHTADGPTPPRDAGRAPAPRNGGGAAAPRDAGGAVAPHDVSEAGEAATLRVVVADDQRVIRDGMRLMLSLVGGVDVVAVAGDGDEALAAVARHDPDVVLMDLRMPRCDGVTATRRVRAEHPRTQVVVLTTFAEDAEMLAALRAGARGYLTKDADADEVVRALRRVVSGEADLTPQIQRRLLELLPRHEPGPPPDNLTDRELQVLRLIAAGLSNTEIAARLHVSDATVKTHINHLFAKTGVRDRAQAVAYAYRHGLTD